MNKTTIILLLAFSAVNYAAGVPLAKAVPGPGGEDWGYLDVRTGAHMFYWLYTSTAAPDPTTLPIVIWLQGGPGAGSTGYGNFEEMGPLDANLQPRNSSWVHHVNLVFLDNPVGAGYSYVDSLGDLATDVQGIASDLVEFMKLFYVKYPEFLPTPVYVFSQSYGAKMAAYFGLGMDRAIKAGDVVSNFKGVVLGDGWVAPVESTISWANYLLQTGVVNTAGRDAIDNVAQQCRVAAEEGRWVDSSQLWSDTEVAVLIYGENVDFYNILYKTPPFFLDEILSIKDLRKRAYKLATRSPLAKDIYDLMNGPIYDKLSATLPFLSPWDSQGDAVFDANWEDFMKPAMSAVEDLLTNTTLTVAVDNGQLDLICATPAQVIWTENLRWPGQSSWLNAPRDSFTVDGLVEGYVKRSGLFSFWWLYRAGHSVPFDNPWGSIVMLREIVGLPPQKNTEFVRH